MIKKMFLLAGTYFIATIALAQATEDVPANLDEVLQSVASKCANNFISLRGARIGDTDTEEYMANPIIDGASHCLVQVNCFGTNYTQWITMFTLSSKEKEDNVAIYDAWYKKIKGLAVFMDQHNYQWSADPVTAKFDGDDGISKTFTLTTVTNQKILLTLSLVEPPPVGGNDEWGLTLSIRKKK